jgi:hypothetical protein
MIPGYTSTSKTPLIYLSLALVGSILGTGISSITFRDANAVISDDIEFLLPQDVQLDSSGHVYVADSENN